MPRADSSWSSFFIALPSPLKERVKEAAAKDHRTMAQWIQVLIARHFEAKDAECETFSSGSSYGTPDSSSVSSQPVSNPTTDTKGNGPIAPFNPPWLSGNGR